MNNGQLRRFLELTCDRIEALAAHYHLPIRITGGRVEADKIKLYYTPQLGFPVDVQESMSRFLHTRVNFGFGWIEVCEVIPQRKPILNTIQHRFLEVEHEEKEKHATTAR